MNKKIKCIGFIMDGNRRYAKKHGKGSIAGHRAGYNKFEEVLNWVKEVEIDHAIVFAFSTENWNRGRNEIKALMLLLKFTLTKRINELDNQGVKLKFVGDLSRYNESFRKLMDRAEKQTEKNPMTLYIALSYGGRAEILNAVKEISKLSSECVKKINEETLMKYFWTKDMPDPDLIIRTGGEMRMSNFLPYQSVYSELFFTKTLWPDFAKSEFEAILEEFGQRKRNHGK